ncbi:MAG TPA: TetR/AcrR family transcriptional regulator, partial [Chloroflexota bacterium]|nr:TetR/AcrR family transcriptional regulator [Chloroflexota bacterium]
MTDWSVIERSMSVAERVAGRSEQKRLEKRRAILGAATSLFSRNGFAETGVSDIARTAGVSHGTVFLYFPSKEALFRAAVLDPLEEFATRSLEVLDGEGSPLERIRRLVRDQVRVIAAERSYLQMVQAAMAQRERFADLTGEIATTIEYVVARLAGVVADGIQEGELDPGSPMVIAASYIAYLNGVGLTVRAAEDSDWEELIEQGIRLFAPLKGDR